MTPTELNHFRHKLLDLKRRLCGDLSSLEKEALKGMGGEASGGISDVPLHPADLGTDTYDEEISLGLLENEAQILRETTEALDRIDHRSYGQCETCNREIPQERLEAVPYTRHCLTCARRLQKNRES